MRGLPDHLDYEEVSDGKDWWPLVSCSIPGCQWNCHAVWSDLGTDDYGLDWNAMHPEHEEEK